MRGYALAARLRAILPGRPGRVVFFAADDGASYEAAMWIIDLINREGGKIGIATEL